MPDDHHSYTGEVVLDISDIRFNKVVRSKEMYGVERVSDGRYIVKKDGSTYFVGLERSNTLLASCNCPDWRFHSRKVKVPCKHIWLVAELEGLVAFPPRESLPSTDEEGVPKVDQEKDAGHDLEEEVEDIDIPLD